jgi:N-methylhydantoinase B
MFGGLPSCTNQFAILRDSDVEARLATGEVPGELEEVAGRLEVFPAYAQTRLASGDVYRTVSQGGGGYGDAIDREPERVARDVANGLVSLEWARRTYGVELDQAGHVDVPATSALRHKIRETRRRAAGAAPQRAPSPWEAGRPRVRLGEALFYDLGTPGEPRLRCRCGHVLGPATVPPKRLMAMARWPVQTIGPEVNPYAINGARFELREFYCPSCGTRLEVEVARPEDPLLDDANLAPGWLEGRT